MKERSSSRKPPWLRVPPPWGGSFADVRRTLRDGGLHTVCEAARCPNIGECFGCGTATFLLMGNVCTRSCRFCNIATAAPAPLDPDEPRRVAEATARLALTFAVLTSVTRDDLPDGGARHFAAAVRAIHDLSPTTGVEVLIPDLQGCPEALRTILDACPTVLNHNIETVPRLYPTVRPQASFRRSLELLGRAGSFGRSDLIVKTGLMVGLGETPDEVVSVMGEVRGTGCTSLTIGQYLPPSADHAELDRYVEPAEFASYAETARTLGFTHVVASPLARSSYHAAAGASPSSCPPSPAPPASAP